MSFACLVFQYDDLGTIGALYLAAVSAEDTRSGKLRPVVLWRFRDLDAGRMSYLGHHALCCVSILSVSKILIRQISGK